MNFKGVLACGGLAGAGLLLYGAMYETARLKLRHLILELPTWPRSHDGYRIGLMADLHVRDAETIALARVASEFLAGEKPNAIVIPGDLIAYHRDDFYPMLSEAISPLAEYSGPKLAVPGNHEYFGGDAEAIRSALEGAGVQLLRNEPLVAGGVEFFGIDSAAASMADPYGTVRLGSYEYPTIVLWHEPDMADYLPRGLDLMLSGHSHGGQFVTPWGYAPVRTKLGRKYLRGLYTEPDVPVFVTTGLATTGPPARLFCPPEALILEIYSPTSE